jgi:hypothetical protein
MDVSANNLEDLFDFSSTSITSTISNISDISDSIIDELMEEYSSNSSIDDIQEEEIDMIAEYLTFEEIDNLDK